MSKPQRSYAAAHSSCCKQSQRQHGAIAAASKHSCDSHKGNACLQERDFLPVLLALARLARSPTAAAAEDGAADQSRKVAAIGLVDPPAHAITAVVSTMAL